MSAMGERVFLWIFSILIFGSFLGALLQDVSPVKLSPLFFLLAYGPLIAIHELAHAGVARLLGWRIREIVIGAGPLWRGFEVGKTAVRINKLPLSGYVRPHPPKGTPSRIGHALIYLAGPLSELGVILVIWLLLGDALFERVDHLGVILAQSIAAAAAFGALTNLVPLTMEDGAFTDGLGALVALSFTEGDYDEWRLSQPLEGARRILEEGHAREALSVFETLSERAPGALAAHFGEADALVALGRRPEAILRLAALERQTAARHAKRRVQLKLREIREGRRQA